MKTRSSAKWLWWLCGWLCCSSCNLGGPPGEQPIEGPLVVAHPPGGQVAAPLVVTLSASRPAQIYYTLDGTRPGPQKTAYKAPFTLWTSVTVRFVAVDKEGRLGPESEATYHIDSLFPHTRAVPAGGNYDKPQTVRLVPDEGSRIYYSLGPDEPTTTSLSYRQPIPIKEDTTLRFFAVDLHGNKEPVQTEVYNFPPQVTVAPSGGVYGPGGVILRLEANERSEIYYTLDGTEPTRASQRYTRPFLLQHSAELRYRAYDALGLSSQVSAAQYQFVAPLSRGDISVSLSAPRAMLAIDPEGLGQPGIFFLEAQRLSLLARTATGFEPLTTALRFSYQARWIRSWDVDGDGLQDILVGDDKGKVHLYLALDRRRFQEDPSLLPLAGLQVIQAVPLDYDSDGQLDLFLLVQQENESRLLHREGFRYRLIKAGRPRVQANARGALAGDFDGNGKADLLLLPGKQRPPYLLYGDGTGGFREHSFEVYLRQEERKLAWLHAARGDLDRDGDLDLLLLGRGKFTPPGGPEKKEPPPTEESLRLVLLHNKGGQSWERSSSFDLQEKEIHHLALFDPDGDGYPDLLVITPRGPRLLTNFLGRELRDGTEAAGLLWSAGRTMTFADLGANGGTDLLLFGQGGSLRVFSSATEQRSLRVIVRGIQGNRSAIGARMTLRVGSSLLLREVGPRSTDPGQGELAVTLGLGAAQKAGPLVVTWPDGKRREFPTPELNKPLTVSPAP